MATVTSTKTERKNVHVGAKQSALARTPWSTSPQQRRLTSIPSCSLPSLPPLSSSGPSALLENDIGVLMMRRGQRDEAARRFLLALEKPPVQKKPPFLSKSSRSISTGGVVVGRPSPTERDFGYGGLEWFHRRLAAEDCHQAHQDTFNPTRRRRSAALWASNGALDSNAEETDLATAHSGKRSPIRNSIQTVAAPISPAPARTASFTASRKVSTTPVDVGSHRTLPCNGKTPPGLEYFGDPISVGGISASTTLSDDHRESAARNAARINLAALAYENNHMDQALQWLQAASTQESNFDTNKEDNLFALICQVTAFNGAGVILFRKNKFHDARNKFIKAMLLLEQHIAQNTSLPEQNNHASCFQSPLSASLPPIDYLLAGTYLNVARALILQKAKNNNTKENNENQDLSRARHLCNTVIPDLCRKYCRQKASSPYRYAIQTRMKWICKVSNLYILGILQSEDGDKDAALDKFTRFCGEARKEFGHDHMYVAAALRRRAAVLFDQRRLHCATLSYLACLHIMESPTSSTDDKELGRLLYDIGRTLHDREEYRDALRMYGKALTMQRKVHGPSSIPVITTMCNVAKIHRMMGDVDAALRVNRDVVKMAVTLAGGRTDHPFVAHQLKILGNVLVEAGRLNDAMEVFAQAARADPTGATIGYDDARESRAAQSLAESGLRHPDAAAA